MGEKHISPTGFSLVYRTLGIFMDEKRNCIELSIHAVSFGMLNHIVYSIIVYYLLSDAYSHTENTKRISG